MTSSVRLAIERGSFGSDEDASRESRPNYRESKEVSVNENLLIAAFMTRSSTFKKADFK